TANYFKGGIACDNKCTVNGSINVTQIDNNSFVTRSYLFSPTGSGTVNLEVALSEVSYYLSDNLTKVRYTDTAKFAVTTETVTSNILSPPTITLENNLTIEWNNNYTFDLDVENNLIYFQDDDKDDAENITWTYNQTQNITIAFSNTTHKINISPDINWTGREDILFNATDTDNLSTTKVLSVFVGNSTEELCDGTDNDGDTLIDENHNVTADYTLTEKCCDANFTDGCITDGTRICTSNGWSNCSGSVPRIGSIQTIGNGGSSGVSAPTSISITSPQEGDVFRVRELLSAGFQSEGIYDHEWNFGDGTTSEDYSPTHSYENPGKYTISITGWGDQATKKDSVTINVVECFTNAECETGLCCEGICAEAVCAGNNDCPPKQGFELIGCSQPNTCEAVCEYKECTNIMCYNNTGCDDKNEGTYDICRLAGSCDAYCVNTPIKITINEPEQGEVYTEQRVRVDFETNYPVECSYQLNNGNVQSAYNNIFKVNSRMGSNILKIMCGTVAKSVVYFVEPELKNETMEDIVEPKEEKPILESMLQEGQLITLTREETQLALEEINRLTGLVATRSVDVSEGRSVIHLALQNPKLIDVKNIQIKDTIPKSIVPAADWITSRSPYKIIEHDPVLGFIIGYLRSGHTQEISYTMNTTITEEDLKLILSEITSEDAEEQLKDVQSRQEATQNVTKITQNVRKIDGRTMITSSLDPTKKLKDVKVYLLIPKCMAEHVEEIDFSDENYKVITDDPLIMWHFEEINQKVDILYELKKDVPEWCWKQLKVIPIAEEIGGDVQDSGSVIQTMIPVLIIPVIAVILIFFSRYAPKEGKSKSRKPKKKKSRKVTHVKVKGRKVPIRRKRS
ncbi:PKD domain-containing protein, partial [Candidatus Woesearchaeota archaeon]|nr:PKD domain-containing protein [Candidatus Woesearchaeota archaeon]